MKFVHPYTPLLYTQDINYFCSIVEKVIRRARSLLLGSDLASNTLGIDL